MINVYLLLPTSTSLSFPRLVDILRFFLPDSGLIDAYITCSLRDYTLEGAGCI